MQPNLHLIYPMFAMVILTIVVAVFTFRNRVRAVREGMSATYFKTYNSATPPAYMVQADRHYVNLFEMPVLFYAGCIVAMIMPLVGFWVNFWAWGFVVARVIHAYIHMGPNKVYFRMSSFMAGVVAVIGLWIQIVLSI